MFPDGGDAFAFVWVGEMRHDDFHVWETDRHIVDEARQRTFERRLVNESRTGMKKNRQPMSGSVFPKVVKFAVVWVKAGIHGHQLDALEFQFLVTVMELFLPSRLCGIE